MFKEYFNETQIEHLKKHSYKTTGYSWLDNKMNPFWEYCARALPYVSKLFFLFKKGFNTK